MTQRTYEKERRDVLRYIEALANDCKGQEKTNLKFLASGIRRGLHEREKNENTNK